MSVLELPRIYFRGKVSWDPITTNNYNSNYDEDQGETIYPNASDKVKAFRQQAIDEITSDGNWNPQGTHRVAFYETAVNGFDLDGALQIKDPFVSAAVNFQGMLVDLEPFGAFTSQLFFDSMLFGVDGGYRIKLPRTMRFIDRYLNFSRNGVNAMIAGRASVVWQSSFAKSDGLRIDAFDSKALQQLDRALQSNDILGLTVRFNSYRTIYYDDPSLTDVPPATKYAAAAKAQQTILNAGGFQPNPARGLVVGVVGLWRAHEPAQEPGDRTLIPAASGLGSIWARAKGSKLVLDFSNSVPEVDQHLKKKDLGALEVGTVDPDGTNFTHLASFDYSHYDRQSYEASAGLVTLDLPSGTDLTKDLQVRNSSKQAQFQEVALRAIPVKPNIYLNEGDQITASIQVYQRGEPLKAQVPVTLFEMDSSGGVIVNKTATKTDSSGVLPLPLPSGKGQVVAYVASVNSSDQPTTQRGINPQSCTYQYIRVHPADQDIASLPPTWTNVYEKVLANWNAMAPCMDNWLDLKDPNQVKAYAPIIKRLTDPANFEHYRYMPIVRDLSPGQRTLLYKFLDGPVVAEPSQTSFADLSRSYRRPHRT
jgi:hypothetical protein